MDEKELTEQITFETERFKRLLSEWNQEARQLELTINNNADNPLPQPQIGFVFAMHEYSREFMESGPTSEWFQALEYAANTNRLEAKIGPSMARRLTSLPSSPAIVAATTSADSNDSAKAKFGTVAKYKQSFEKQATLSTFTKQISAISIESQITADENPFEQALEEIKENEDDVFSDKYQVDESWLQNHVNPFDSVYNQSASMNPALLLDFDNDDDGQGSDENVNRAAQMNLKNTWIQSVDPNIASKLTKEEKKRQEAIFELIYTESVYVMKLQTIIEIFMMPLISSQPPLVNSNDLVSIFLNIESILLCHVKILSDLEVLQRRDKLNVRTIGVTLLKHLRIIENMQNLPKDETESTLLAYIEYCSKQMTAIQLLQSWRTANPKFEEFLLNAKQDSRCKGLDLSAFLLEPMQRITRYPLLLKQIIHYTPKDHKDQPDLLESLRFFETLLSRVNQAAKEAESHERIQKLNNAIIWTDTKVHMDLTAPTRFLGSRMLLHDGTLFKAKSGKKLHVFLFNDVLLFTTPIKEGAKSFKQYKQPMLISDIRLRKSNSETGAYMGIESGPDLLILKAADPKTRNLWVKQIENAVKAINKAKMESKTQVLERKACIGTLSVLVIAAIKLKMPSETMGESVFCQAQVGDQSGQTITKQLTSDNIARWSQPLLFSIQNLDDYLNFEVYAGDGYSKDELVGQGSVQLDFLEYYRGKDTEKISLDLHKDSIIVGNLLIKLNYKPQI